MAPQITCPHCGNTINLENRKEVDFEKITSALNGSTKTFTELLEVTNLPRKTLSLRLKDLCAAGTVVKDGGYHLGASFQPIRTYGAKKNGNGKMNRNMLHIGKNVQWIPVVLIACLVLVAFGSAIIMAPPGPGPTAPTASFFISPTANTIAGQSLTFDAAFSKATSGTITNYIWDFGDGSPSTSGQIVTYTYTTPGTYTVTLQVTANGLSTTKQETVIVSPVQQPAPTIKFAVLPDPSIGWENHWIIGKQLTFDASAFNAAAGYASYYSWNFGDGSPSANGQIVTYTYTAPGTYNTTLTVKTLTGTMQSVVESVQISPMPAATISANLPAQYSIGDTITVNVMITNITNLYDWQAGMTFNPLVIQAVTTIAPNNTVTQATQTAFVEGSFLKDNGNTWWLTGPLDNNAGTIGYYGCNLVGNTTTGVSGSGMLFSINFKVVSQGPLNIHLTNVSLRDINDAEIPVYVAT